MCFCVCLFFAEEFIHVDSAIIVQYVHYLCFVLCSQSGVQTHLPVGSFSDVGHNQLCALNARLRRVVHGCIVTLRLLGATHAEDFDVQ